MAILSNILLLILLQADPPSDTSNIWTVIGVAIGVGGLLITVFLKMNDAAKDRGRQEKSIEILESNFEKIETDVKTIPVIEQVVETLVDKVDGMVDKMDNVSKQMQILAAGGDIGYGSPIKLTESGIKIVNSSGIKNFINDNRREITKRLNETNPKNAFQCQVSLFEVVKGLKDNIELLPVLEEISFKSGRDINTILYLGAIDIRDEVLRECKYDPSHIDEQEES